MGIYNRDQINYASMIDNAIKNRMNQVERESDRIVKRGDIRAKQAEDLASTFARGMDYLQYESEQKALEKKLKDLEDRRDYIRSQYTANADYKPYSTTDEYKASKYMSGYKPSYDTNEVVKYNTTPSTYLIDEAKTKWLQAHPGMTEDDYDKFVEYHNSIYGGR